MNYWLMKSEPITFGIDHLVDKEDQITCWEGVRNYQARNFMRDEMRLGDLAFFYHSNCKIPGIVGVVKVVKTKYPDFTALDPQSEYYDPKSSPQNPRWFMVDVQLVEKFTEIVSLKDLRDNPLLKDMLILQKGNRLSITPLTQNQWTTVMAMKK